MYSPLKTPSAPVAFKNLQGINNYSIIQSVLLLCGIFSSLLYLFMNIYVVTQYAGYNWVDQTISELSAIGAPTRDLWVLLGLGYAILTLAFGWGLVAVSSKNHPLRVAGLLLLAHSAVGLVWPFFPMHQREVLAAGGGTTTDIMHIVVSAITVLLMMGIIAYGRRAFGKAFKTFSFVTIPILLVFGILTSMSAPDLQANLPTPWLGVWERICIAVYMVWVVVLAVRVLQWRRP
jgi:hypothetical protein